MVECTIHCVKFPGLRAASMAHLYVFVVLLLLLAPVVVTADLAQPAQWAGVDVVGLPLDHNIYVGGQKGLWKTEGRACRTTHLPSHWCQKPLDHNNNICHRMCCVCARPVLTNNWRRLYIYYYSGYRVVVDAKLSMATEIMWRIYRMMATWTLMWGS